ncbi:MAG: phosphotransferase family protein [Acidimicrobiales bacterium]
MDGSASATDVERLSGWFVANVDEITPPLRLERLGEFAAMVQDGAGRAWVVRRGGHDAARHHRVVCALAGGAVPVPAPAGFCADQSVIGAPFSVRQFVEGNVVASASDAAKMLDPDGRLAAGDGLVDALAALGAVDVDRVGLGDLGPRQGYLAGQVARWRRRLETGQEASGRCLLLVHDLAGYIEARLPPEPAVPSLIHGNYRLDTVVLGDDGRVRAVLGWSGATLGDPLVDLGQLLAYWTDPGQENEALGVAPTAVAGFPGRREVALRYAEQSGRDLDRLSIYVGFAYWKLACILEEVHGRARAGGRADAAYLDELSHQVLRLAGSAREALGGP